MRTAIAKRIGCLVGGGLLAAVAGFAQLPDLVVKYPVSSPKSGWPGQTFDPAAYVRNYGDGVAGESILRYSLSPLTSPDDTTDDIVIGGCGLPMILPGGGSFCGSHSQLATIPIDLPPGEYLFIATADADDDVVESNESNNSRQSDTGPLLVTEPDFQCLVRWGGGGGRP